MGIAVASLSLLALRCVSSRVGVSRRIADSVGKRRRYFSTIAISAAALACYFPAAFYLKTSYSNHRPAGLRPLAVYRTGVPHIYAASIWLPDTVDSVEIYENGTRIGTSDTVYLHPERTYTFDGKHWKIVEFKLDYDPVGNGKAYAGLPVR